MWNIGLIWKTSRRGLREERFWERGGCATKDVLKRAKNYVLSSVFATAVQPNQEKQKKHKSQNITFLKCSALTTARSMLFAFVRKRILQKSCTRINGDLMFFTVRFFRNNKTFTRNLPISSKMSFFIVSPPNRPHKKCHRNMIS